MPPPSGPHIRTTYAKDGTMKQEPVGFGGTLCKVATQPYQWRQGNKASDTPTAEAEEPSLLERESDGGQKHRA